MQLYVLHNIPGFVIAQYNNGMLGVAVQGLQQIRFFRASWRCLHPNNLELGEKRFPAIF